MNTTFELRTIVDSTTHACALAFLTESEEAADAYFTRIVETMYAPMGRGSSHLTLTTHAPRSIILDAFSGSEAVTVEVSGAAENVADAVNASLAYTGAVVVLFGWISPDGFALLKPTGNHLARREAVIDGELITGGHFNADIMKNFLALLDQEAAS